MIAIFNGKKKYSVLYVFTVVIEFICLSKLLCFFD